MKRNQRVRNIAIAGLLSALGIMIPMIMPIKIMVGGSTYTLASHVPIFVAMFINPSVGIFVALTTALGFLLGGWPIVVVLRALSHILFVIPGVMYLNKHELNSPKQIILFNIVIALIHGLAEFSVVTLLSIGKLNSTLIVTYLIFAGLGTMIHSSVDFFLSLGIIKPLNIQKPV